jgi:REP element-mobilizing transposase RayT
MPRPPRVQFPGALYHVTAQGNRDSALYVDASDRQLWMSLLSLTCAQHDWQIHAWCQMTTHYHLLLTTPAGDLAAGMHRLNSRYAHCWNERHREKGHLFRARYGAKIVDSEEYLHEAYRYIAMNPVKAGICRRPEDWRWSSFAYLFGGVMLDLPSDERWLLSHFGTGAAARATLREIVYGEPLRLAA